MLCPQRCMHGVHSSHSASDWSPDLSLNGGQTAVLSHESASWAMETQAQPRNRASKSFCCGQDGYPQARSTRADSSRLELCLEVVLAPSGQGMIPSPMHWRTVCLLEVVSIQWIPLCPWTRTQQEGNERDIKRLSLSLSLCPQVQSSGSGFIISQQLGERHCFL